MQTFEQTYCRLTPRLIISCVQNHKESKDWILRKF